MNTKLSAGNPPRHLSRILTACLVNSATIIAALTALPATAVEDEYHEAAVTIVKQLSLDEKAALYGGRDSWHFGGIDRLKVPATRVADCGHGVTLFDQDGRATTCLPTAIAMGATWDPELIERAGALIGRECRALGVGILLGPMVNLHRLPVGGRNCETFSEDPYLTGVLAAALVRGIQSTGTGACVKAVACNAQQKFQITHSVVVDPRTLHELYLRHFAYVVREAAPAALMTSYNKINGLDTAAHPGLIKGFIRDELNFNGIVMSDWGGVHGPEVILAGLDLEMPGLPNFATAKAVRAAVDRGALTPAELDAHATRILRANLAYAVRPEQPAALDTPEHRSLAREVAESAITLLKNEKDTLPLDLTRIKRVAVIGPNAAVARLGGSGSASVNPSYAVSLLDGLRTRLGDGVEISYAEGCSLFGNGEVPRGLFSHRSEDGKIVPGLHAEYFNGNGLTLADAPAHTQAVDAVDFSWAWSAPAPGVGRRAYTVRITGELMPDRDGPAELRLVYQGGGARLKVNGRLVHERWDPEIDGNFEARDSAATATVQVALERGRPVPLTIEYRRLSHTAALRLEWVFSGAPSGIEEAVKTARSADVAIVCAGLSNLLEGGTIDRPTLALPAGQDELIAAVTAANPRTIVVLNGGTALAMPWLPQVSAVLHAYYPGEEGGSALARIICGDVAPSGRLPDTLPLHLADVPGMAYYPGTAEQVVFGEGIFVGYRHFVTDGVKPLFPFGYGLTYTTFSYSNLKLSAPDLTSSGALEASVKVTNTGRRDGAEVVQLYVGAVAPSVPRPAYELRAFKKIFLAPGESRRVSFTLSAADVAFYSERESNWISEAGEYTLQIGPHCADGLKQRFSFAGGAIR